MMNNEIMKDNTFSHLSKIYNEKQKKQEIIDMYNSYIVDYIKFEGLFGKINLYELKKAKNSVDLSGLMMYVMVKCNENPNYETSDNIAKYIIDQPDKEFRIFINNIK